MANQDKAFSRLIPGTMAVLALADLWVYWRSWPRCSRTGPRHGQTVFIDPAMVKATQSDAHLNAEFSHPGHPLVSLWIAC